VVSKHRRGIVLGVALLAQALAAVPAFAEPTGAAALDGSDLVDITASNLADPVTSSLVHNLNYDLSFLGTPTNDINQSASQPPPGLEAIGQSLLGTGLLSLVLGGLGGLGGGQDNVGLFTQSGQSSNMLEAHDALGNSSLIAQTATVALPEVPAGSQQPMALVIQSASQDNAGRQGATSTVMGFTMPSALNLIPIR
jgi:hypothetical protein